MIYRKALIFLFYLITIFLIYPQDSINIYELKPLLDGINKFYIFSNEKNTFITYLDDSMNLRVSLIIYKDKKIILSNTISIYNYHKEDNLVYLKAFYNNGIFYIFHIEKFSKKLMLTYFDNRLKPKNIIVASDISLPEIFIFDNMFNIFYLSNNRIIFESIKLKNFKKNIIEGEKNISNFKILNNSNLYAILWKFRDKKDYIYFSIMDKNLKGMTKIYKIVYKKDNLPFALFYDNKFNIIFNYNRINYSFILEIKDKGIENLTNFEGLDIFSDHEIIDFVNNKDHNFIIFRDRIEIEKKRYLDLVKLIKLSEDFNLISSFIIKKIDELLIEQQFIYIDGKLFLFLIDSYKKTLKYLIIE